MNDIDTLQALSLSTGIARCRSCHNTAELNQDAFCGDCATDFHTMVNPPVEGAQLDVVKVPGAPQPPKTDLKATLLDYIITNATPSFIEEIYQEKLKEHKRELRWIEWMEQEPNERKLMRIATELGYGKPVKARKTRTDKGVKRVEPTPPQTTSKGKNAKPRPHKSA